MIGRVRVLGRVCGRMMAGWKAGDFRFEIGFLYSIISYYIRSSHLILSHSQEDVYNS